MAVKILYISYDGMTDPLGQSQVLPYLCGLGQKGYEFHLISCEKPEKFGKHKLIIESICKQYNISWHPLPYTKRPPVISTMRDLKAIRRKATALHQQHNFEIVHCRSYIPAMVGLEMKKKYGTGFLFDMRGFWADEKVDAGTWNLDNPLYRTIYRYFKNKELAFLRHADYTISLTEAGREEIHSWTRVPNNPVKIQVIPCCADLGLFSRDEVNQVLRKQVMAELGTDENDHLLGYLGSIGSWYMLDEMLDFFKVYLLRKPGSKFLFITLDQHELIRSSALAKGIPATAILIRPALRAEVPTVLSLCRYSIFFIRPTYSKTASSPTKQAELMGMGIPIICNSGVGDTAGLVKKYNSGITIDTFSDKQYAQATDQLSDSGFDREQIRKGAFEYFSLDGGIDKYASVYQSVLTGKKTRQT